jgi:hypothetical protein
MSTHMYVGHKSPDFEKAKVWKLLHLFLLFYSDHRKTSPVQPYTKLLSFLTIIFAVFDMHFLAGRDRVIRSKYWSLRRCWQSELNETYFIIIGSAIQILWQ